MARVYSTRTMVERLEGCIGTGELTPDSEAFVARLRQMRIEERLTSLTEKQLDYLESLHNKHFA